MTCASHQASTRSATPLTHTCVPTRQAPLRSARAARAASLLPVSDQPLALEYQPLSLEYQPLS